MSYSEYLLPHVLGQKEGATTAYCLFIHQSRYIEYEAKRVT